MSAASFDRDWEEHMKPSHVLVCQDTPAPCSLSSRLITDVRQSRERESSPQRRDWIVMTPLALRVEAVLINKVALPRCVINR